MPFVRVTALLRQLLFALCALIALSASCYLLIRLVPGWLTDDEGLSPAEADEVK